MKNLILLIVIILAGCAHKGGDSGVNPQQCKAVQKSCTFSGVYDEWVRENGTMMCSCQRINQNPEPNQK